MIDRLVGLVGLVGCNINQNPPECVILHDVRQCTLAGCSHKEAAALLIRGPHNKNMGFFCFFRLHHVAFNQIRGDGINIKLFPQRLVI